MKYIIFLPVSILMLACSPSANESDAQESLPDPYNHIKQQEVRDILRSAIDKAGGIETWRNLKEIRYRKHSILYLSDSSIESEVIQEHVYNMSPEFAADITWESEGESHLLRYTKDLTQKFVNDTLQDANEESLRQSVMSAIYVLGMPFKLLDPGVQLTYKGETDVDGTRAHAIEARYSSEDNDNHSTDDLWWYYFDVRDYAFIGALVYHAPTYALIRNLKFDESTAIKFHAHRKSYRTDSLRNKEYLRAQFWYSDYQIRQLDDAD